MSYETVCRDGGVFHSVMQELVDAVNDMIADGWKPLGGVSVAYAGIGTGWIISQAMKKG